HIPELTIGSATSDFLPRPDFVRRDTIAELMRVASTRVRRKNREKAGPQIETWRKQWEAEFGAGPSDAEIEALLDIGPEACAFRLTKEIVKKVLEAASDARVEQSYERRFGKDSFKRLMSLSTFMPVQYYALCVRAWHAETIDGKSVGQLDPSRRLKLLHERLLAFLEEILDARTELPSDLLLGRWADAIAADLSLEGPPVSARDVTRQRDGYASLKETGRRNRASRQCVQCACLIEPGTGAEASVALGNLGSYSNRRLAFANPRKGEPPICQTCVVDLELGQLSVGRPVETAIALVPRRSLGPSAGEELARRVRELRSTLDRQLSPE